jgi:MFS family permease
VTSDPVTPPAEFTGHPLRIPDFRSFWTARLFAVLGSSAQSTAIAWHIYETARERHYSIEQSALFIGMLGLVQFLALFALSVPGGIVADRYDRKKIAGFVIVAQFLVSLGFLIFALIPGMPIWPVFVLASCMGALRAFSAPATSAMGPMLVPKSILPRAIAVNAMAFQVGTIAGPSLGGLLVGLSPTFAYATCAVMQLVAAVLFFTIKAHTTPEPPSGSKMEMLKEGIVYIRDNKIVLGAISLDLFAVLLGGATALLPIFARDVLHVGSSQFGLLRSAMGIGAVLTSIYLSQWPLKRHAGRWMFLGVGVFGLSTIVFGLSQSYWLSVGSMAVLGAADMISVYVRGTLVQIVTPDHMRGRVASVAYLFIGASNELGEFESGVTASLFGPVGAALFGGIGSLIVTGAWIKLFPQLYKADKLE